MSSLLSDTADLTTALADKDKVIGELITNLTKVMDTVSEHNDEFDSCW